MHDSTIARERARSLKLVQTVFVAIAAISLALSLSVHLELVGWPLLLEDAETVSRAFLILALANTSMIFVWEWLLGTGTRAPR